MSAARLYKVTLTSMLTGYTKVFVKVYHVAATSRKQAIRLVTDRQFKGLSEWIHAECVCISGGLIETSFHKLERPHV
jgi:hypothetical protein